MYSSGKRTALDYARMVSGGLCLAAGIAKALPQVEDVGAVLGLMAEANADTLLAPLSELIVANTGPMTVLVGLALAGSGLAFLTGRLLIPAAIGQIAMLIGFMTLLFRFQPAIVLIDLPFLVVALLVLRRELGRRGAEAPGTFNQGRTS
ncbi:DUF6041 domain-containing protein [Sagittula sp. S175]|uniref:DUF6041 domain-containing protein n=1 Tax=Sagittula sp. S175 TaxID=3415129 RepID=UPI003C7CEC41